MEGGNEGKEGKKGGRGGKSGGKETAGAGRGLAIPILVCFRRRC